MTRSRIPTQAELDTALWLDGHAAIKVAEVAHGAPGWPPLLQLVAGDTVHIRRKLGYPILLPRVGQNHPPFPVRNTPIPLCGVKGRAKEPVCTECPPDSPHNKAFILSHQLSLLAGHQVLPPKLVLVQIDRSVGLLFHQL